MQSGFFPFLQPDKVGSRVAPSNLPVIRRRCCSALLARQVWDLLSLFISFSSLVSFLLSRISVPAPCSTEEVGLYNLPGYLPTSLPSFSLTYSLIPSFFFRVSFLLFTYLPPRDSLCCSQRFASLITSPRVILSLPLSLPPSLSPPPFRLPRGLIGSQFRWL